MTDKEIEKAASQHADGIKVLRGVPGALVPMLHDIAKSSFVDGARFALSHQWVSVEDALPEDDRYFYLVADVRLDPLGVDCAEYTCETKLFSRGGKILHPTHWCPIPPPNPEKE